MKIHKSLLRGAVVAAAAAALMVPSVALAQGGPPAGRGHGGGEETTANNLSVPTIMVGGGSFTGVTCPDTTPGALVTPTGDPLTGYPINPAAYYYVQGVNTWQAQCYSTTSASATAAWGDNLTGDAKLSLGSPIRVELGLLNSDPAVASMDGYTVVKLDPNALDRESAYGTLATGSPTTGFSASPTTFTATLVRVYDSAATLSIKNDTTGTYVVPDGTSATAEINATGNVVYGYNLRVTTAGDYTITFTMPNVNFTGQDAGTATGDTATLTIHVPSGGGGVGRGGGAGGGNGGGHHGGR